MKRIILKILFYLSGVSLKTKNLILFEDLEKYQGKNEDLEKQVIRKYLEAKAKAYNVQNFTEWLYYQMLIKQRSYVLSASKEQQTHRRAEIIYLLWLLNELREADESFTRKLQKNK